MNMQNVGINGVFNYRVGANMDGCRIIKRNGEIVPLDLDKIRDTLARACAGYSVSVDALYREVIKNLFDKMSTADLEKTLIMAVKVFIEIDPEYDAVASRLVLSKLFREVYGKISSDREFEINYKNSFTESIKLGVQGGLFSDKLMLFDLEYLSQQLDYRRDNLLGFMGLTTICERYIGKLNGRKIETPQAYWMRVAMGLAINEENKESSAVKFYDIISKLLYMPSTPTLFHSGFQVAQLSSCFLNTVNDDLAHIFKFIGDNAQLAKWAGGIGSDWTSIRGTGGYIKSIKATSQGVIPFLKIANDVVVAITKSGIRRGGTCVYLENWHWDFEEFLDLRRNTGDERRRTHDMHLASWIPDLFMKRVLLDKNWSFFSPQEVPELHSLYGIAFEEKYTEYEELGRQGKLVHYKTIPAKQLWRKMITRLFETGHPWITFKDPCNLRSPQDHVGVINSSNLCTEITLNTSETETAVCNLGSINISNFIKDKQLDEELLKNTISTAMRMLDNVVDLNFYPTQEAKNSNIKHRPVGLGLMGFQDALFKLDIPFADKKALEFADNLMETISYYAIQASSLLAKERGVYSSYKGSKWDRSIFPLDTIDILEKERGMPIEVSRTSTLDWASLKQMVKDFGMRNSNTMAIAPTATISTISGCYPCIEPLYENIYVESNVSGEFTIVNKYLVNDLKALGLWSKEMLDQIKFNDGDLKNVAAIPDSLKLKYQTVFELSPEWLIEITAARAKWIDQSQSHNVFFKGTSGAALNEIYFKAWKSGLKTTYYLRTLGASQIEKSTLDSSFGLTQKRPTENGANVCNIFNSSPDDCESCQ